MKSFGWKQVSVLALATSLCTPVAWAADGSWMNSDEPAGRPATPMPMPLSFEEGAAAGGAPERTALVAPDAIPAAVPEPTTVLLLLAGLGMMIFIVVRRNKD